MPQYAIDIDGQSGFEMDSIPTLVTADGALTISPKRITQYALSHAGGPLALTIGLPVPADDGKIVVVWSLDTVAHVLTQAADGFNHKGAAGTATWNAITANGCLLIVAHAGSWWTLGKDVVVVA